MAVVEAIVVIVAVAARAGVVVDACASQWGLDTCGAHGGGARTSGVK